MTALERLYIITPKTMQEWAIISLIVDHALMLRLDTDEMRLHVEAHAELLEMFHQFYMNENEPKNQNENN